MYLMYIFSTILCGRGRWCNPSPDPFCKDIRDGEKRTHERNNTFTGGRLEIGQSRVEDSSLSVPTGLFAEYARHPFISKVQTSESQIVARHAILPDPIESPSRYDSKQSNGRESIYWPPCCYPFG